VAADGKSGDGCGIMLQFPEPFLRDVARDCGFRLSERFGAGLVFFSPDAELIERGKRILTDHLARVALSCRLARGADRPEFVGEQALASMPAIYQVFVNAPAGWGRTTSSGSCSSPGASPSRNTALPDPDPLYYVVTLSNLTMVYKGLVQAEHLADFYPDLRDPRMTSAIGICHQRFSTNTLPRWNYAQPFRSWPTTARSTASTPTATGPTPGRHPALSAAAVARYAVAPGQRDRFRLLLAR
jgi:glutamate synthase (NADPH) large chain